MPLILPDRTDSRRTHSAPGSVRPCSPSCPRWPTRSRPAPPVVALESTIISHGLPRPDNLRVAREIEQAVRRGRRRPGHHRRWSTAGPASASTTMPCSRSPTGDDVVKVSTRDLATVAARGGMGATTVAATSHLAARAGITVFATGGLGGVHRDARSTWDESADLQALATTDVTDRLRRREVDPRRPRHPGAARDPGRPRPRLRHRPPSPASTSATRGTPLDWRVDSPEEVAAVMAARDGPRHRRPRRRRRQPAAGERAGRPGAARPAAARRPRGRRGRARPRQGRHAVPARVLPPGEQGRHPRGEHPHHPAQRRAGRADRRRLGRGRQA